MNKYRKCKKNISANADGPRDVASCKIDHIAVHAECNHPGNKRCVLYLKHIATQMVTCRLLAHTYTVKPKLHLVDLLSTYYTVLPLANTYEVAYMQLLITAVFNRLAP